MLPASTDSPPNFFTPKRRPALSRPLREEPPAFLCAIVSNYFLLVLVLDAPLAGAASFVDLALGSADLAAGFSALAGAFAAGLAAGLSALAAGAVASFAGAAATGAASAFAGAFSAA